MDEHCCDVVRPISARLRRGGAPTICEKHRSEGWAMFVSMGKPILDRSEREPCGCIVARIQGRRTFTCDLHLIGPRACCTKAKRIFCVCAESYGCPEHGESHYGTHD